MQDLVSPSPLSPPEPSLPNEEVTTESSLPPETQRPESSILGYAFVDGKNISVDLARKGFAEVVIYQKRKPFIYQQELLKAQEEAKKNKIGIWIK